MLDERTLNDLYQELDTLQIRFNEVTRLYNAMAGASSFAYGLGGLAGVDGSNLYSAQTKISGTRTELLLYRGELLDRMLLVTDQLYPRIRTDASK